MPSYKHFLVDTPAPYVAHVQINRPQKLNAFYEEMWIEFKTVFDTLSQSPDVRAIILSGAGDRAFTAGLDVEAASQSGILAQQSSKADPARKAYGIQSHVKEFQDCISSVEKCGKPVICVLHGVCFGLAIDISTCADIRICTSNARLSVKEVDIGVAADIGTLTRLPKVVGNFSWVKDICLSARIFSGDEALQNGFVSYAVKTKEEALTKALDIAKLIATKSPVAVLGTKELLNHARDNSVADSLRYTGIWASAMIQTEDMHRAMMSGIRKTKPTFEKL